MEPQIRVMTASDWPAVARIFTQGIQSNTATFQRNCPTWDEWNTSHFDDCRLVAEKDGFVIGWAALAPVSNIFAYHGVAEVGIFVGDTAHSRDIGFALLQMLCTVADNSKYWTLQSQIMQDNDAHIEMHKECGFRVVGYRERIGKDRNGSWRNTVLLERRNNIS